VGRGGYQELSRQFDADTPQLIRPAVKRIWQPRSPLDLPDKAFRAVREARTGRPGPVALSVSQELWSEEVEVRGWPNGAGYLFDSPTRPDAESVDRVHQALAGAERPLILAGNGVNLGHARAQLRALAERHGIPVATTVAGKGAFPEDHALALGIVGWVGTSTANTAAREADLILVIGSRLSESTASSWQPGVTFDFESSRLVQVDIDPLAVGNAYPVDDVLIGDAALALSDLVEAAGSEEPRDRSVWKARLDDERAEWRRTVEQSQAPGEVGQIGTGAVVAALRRAYDDGPINLVCDCGKHHKWVAQQFEAREDDHIISSMGGAAMGIGSAGAVGAALARPQVPTVSWNGDGGLSMSLSVLPTVAEYQLPIVFVVIDDAAYGVVANGQMDRFGRTAFSEFDGGGTNPGYRLDFEALGEACGIPSRTVEDPGALDDAFGWARSVDGPSLLSVASARRSVHPSGGGLLHPTPWTARQLPWASKKPD
jgi:acetolactate synthase I/II/III large subunit